MGADPSQARIAGERLLQNRRAVDADAIAEGPDARRHGACKFGERAPHELVIVAAQGVARHVAARAIGERARRFACLRGPVVHAHADATHGAGRELVGAAPLRAVALHVVHLAVEARREPIVQMPLVAAEFDMGDTQCVKAHAARQDLQVLFDSGKVDRGGSVRHKASIIG